MTPLNVPTTLSSMHLAIREQLPRQLQNLTVGVTTDPFGLRATVVIAEPVDTVTRKTHEGQPIKRWVTHTELDLKLPDEFLAQVCLEAG